MTRSWPMLCLCLCLALLAGCRQFQEHRLAIDELHASGRYADIAAILDDPQTQKLYGSKSRVLLDLDRGATALALNDTTTTIAKLEDAERAIELRRERTGGDVAAMWLLSDADTAYLAEPYEDMYVNVLKLLAQLEAGRIDGGATVEARRMASKADLLRDRYLQYKSALESKESRRLEDVQSLASLGVEASDSGGQFVESPLGTYLTAITFMKSGDRDLQAVAGRRLVESIRAQRGLIGPVREEDFVALENTRPSDVNILIVALSGRGPSKVARSVGPIPLGTVPIYFELPELRTFPSEVAGARLEIESAGAPGQSVPLALVEDLSAVAAENHRRMLPLIYARTFARAATKAAASTVLTEVGRRRSSDRDQGLVQVLGVLGGLAVMYATEKADVRAWSMLPGQAHVAAASLPPGEHRVRVVYTGSGGGAVHTGDWQTINVTERGLATIVSHYWR